MGEFYQTKSEFYKTLIDIHKKGGQGLSGIVRVKSDLLGQYLDELIEEGLVKCCDTGNSLGHPESNRFYCPTKGYCVWDDEEGSALTCVRLYLGALEPDSPGRTDLQRALHPSLNDLIRHTHFMEIYSKWLKENEKSLKEMLELSDVYNDAVCPDGELPQSAIEYLKTRDWYKENKTIKECLKRLESADKNVDESISLTNQIIKLREDMLGMYKRKGDNAGIETTKKEIEESKSEIEKYKRVKKIRPIIKAYFEKQEKKSLVQDLIK